jgi:hypothetical protein
MKMISKLLIVIALANLCVTSDAITYFSKGSVEATLLSNWSSMPNGTGVSPSYFNTSGDVFVIQNGHSLTVSSNWELCASSGNGKLQISSGGKLVANDTITIRSGNTFQIDNGGIYEHNVASNLSSLLNGNEAFDTQSNFIVLKCAASPAFTDVVFGNLIFKNVVAANLGMNGKLNKVKGNLIFEITALPISKTSNAKFALVGTQNATLDIEGDLIVNSPDGTGSVQMVNGTGNGTVNVQGKVKVQNGTFSLYSGSSTIPGSAALNVVGGIEISGGSLNSPVAASASTIKFLGANSELTKTSGILGNTTNINFEVGANTNLNLNGSFSVGVGRTIKVDGVLSIGESDTLKIGGNVLGNGWIDATNGTIFYSGVTDQIVSNIKNGVIKNLFIINEAGITLSNTLTVTGKLYPIVGTITLGDADLIVPGVAISINGKIIENGLGLYKDVATAVSTTNADQICVSQDGDFISLKGLVQGGVVTVCTMTGQIISTQKVLSNELILKVSKGLFIIRILTGKEVVVKKVIVR